MIGGPAQYLGNPRDFYQGLIEGPSLFGQPLLPGTVVGEGSMKGKPAADNVTAGCGLLNTSRLVLW